MADRLLFPTQESNVSTCSLSYSGVDTASGIAACLSILAETAILTGFAAGVASTITSGFGFSAFITESSILSGTAVKAGIAGSIGFCTDSSFASVWKMEGALRHTWYPRSVQKCTTLSKPLSFETMMRLSSGFLTVYEPR